MAGSQGQDFAGMTRVKLHRLRHANNLGSSSHTIGYTGGNQDLDLIILVKIATFGKQFSQAIEPRCGANFFARLRRGRSNFEARQRFVGSDRNVCCRSGRNGKRRNFVHRYAFVKGSPAHTQRDQKKIG